jgi:hypothetical protein
MLVVVKNINVMVLSLWLSAFTLCPLAVSARDFVVAIDTGHSAEQPGAISARGVGEYFFNKRIAAGVHASLAAQPCGITSFLINNQDGNLALAERARLAAERQADLLLSIHHDSVRPDFSPFGRFRGPSSITATIIKAILCIIPRRMQTHTTAFYSQYFLARKC